MGYRRSLVTRDVSDSRTQIGLTHELKNPSQRPLPTPVYRHLHGCECLISEGRARGTRDNLGLQPATPTNSISWAQNLATWRLFVSTWLGLVCHGEMMHREAQTEQVVGKRLKPTRLATDHTHRYEGEDVWLLNVGADKRQMFRQGKTKRTSWRGENK